MTTFCISLMIAGILFLVVTCIFLPNKDTALILLAIGLTEILSGSLGLCFSTEIPSAMDVYQGKTTLEITYKDGVAIDSTVVFKGD